MKRPGILVTLLLIIVSCRSIPCRNQFITPVFVSFSPADLDTLIVSRYQPGGSFSQLIDTAVFVNDPHVAFYYSFHDSTTVVLNVYSDEEK